ncbi:MAG: beta-lactamase domain protein [Bryobacterales bacterium]|nr:beta-lactamase domain protein [Bryobacterales bacterium]
MSRTVRVRIAVTLFALLGAWAAYTQNSPTPNQNAPRPAVAQKVKDGLYMISGEGGNVAALLTDEGVLLVDDMYDRNYAAVMDQVKSLSEKPVRYVLNTHQHDDHSGSNARMLAASVEIIAHRNARVNMIALKQPGAPRVTFTDEMEVHLGGKEVRTRHYGRGHTGGDAVIYFPELKVIHTGDLFLTRPTQPYIDYANGGSALEWTKALDEVLKLDFDTIIPGHGPLSDRTGLLKWRADFETMRNRIGGMVRQGKSKEEVSQTLVKDFGWPPGGLAIAQVDAFIAEMK